MLQQKVQGHEYVGQVRVRGWSTSFPPQLQLIQELLFPGEDMGRLHPFLEGEAISCSSGRAMNTPPGDGTGVGSGLLLERP